MSDFPVVPSHRSYARLARRIRVVKGDITKQDDVDAIASCISVNMVIEGSLNKALVAAAGQAFDDFILENIYKPKAGDAYAVPGFGLPAKNVIFVVTPLWRDGFTREDVHLLRCYRHAMEMLRNMGLKTIAFPAMGAGRQGYPPERASRLAIRGIMERMDEDIAEVRIVCDNDRNYSAFSQRLTKIS